MDDKKVEKQLSINTEEGSLEEQDVVKPKMTKDNILAAIKAAISSGDLSSQNARMMRANIGVTQADFTRKQVSEEKRKARRKAQRDARRKNRATTKGQKRTSGKRFTAPKT